MKEEENNDYIKMPDDYVVKKDEFGFGGFFRSVDDDDDYDNDCYDEYC